MKRIIIGLVTTTALGVASFAYKGGFGALPPSIKLGSLFSENPTAKWDAKMKLALAALDAGRFEVAAGEFKSALDTARALTPLDCKVAITLENLAVCDLAAAKPKLAREHAQEAVDVFEKTTADDGFAVGNALVQLGRAVAYDADFMKAEESFKRADALFQTTPKCEGPRIECLLSLGNVYQDMGRPRQALEVYRKALELEKQKEEFGKESTTAAQLYTEMGRVYLSSGDFEQAGAHFDRANRMYRGRRVAQQDKQEKQPEPTTSGEAWLAANTASLIVRRGQSIRVEPLFEDALGNLQRNLAQPSREVIFVQREFAVALLAKQKVDAAETLLKKSLVSCQQLYGRKHPELAKSLEAYAEFLSANNRADEAAEHSQKAKEILSALAPLREKDQAKAAPPHDLK